MYYMGFTYVEAYNIPVWQRKWFIQRINKEFQKANEKNQPAQSRAAHTNTPDARTLMGNSRAAVPSRLRRFT
tara:strand:+ start:254 stop:469 length:216 start_codon:yes stop_codon:yes gene_type:complete